MKRPITLVAALATELALWPAARAETVLRVATGPNPGTYQTIANAINDALLLRGGQVRLEVVATRGSLENLDLVEKGSVELALVQNDALAERDGSNPAILLGVFRGETLKLNPKDAAPIRRDDDPVFLSYKHPDFPAR